MKMNFIFIIRNDHCHECQKCQKIQIEMLGPEFIAGSNAHFRQSLAIFGDFGNSQ